MPVIQVEARLSPEQLLEAVDQMSPDELTAFTGRVLELRARRAAPMLSADESPLFARVNRALSAAQQSRYAFLMGRRDVAALTAVEHAELIELSDTIEAIDADRLEALAELSRLRGLSLAQMMTSMGLPHAAP